MALSRLSKLFLICTAEFIALSCGSYLDRSNDDVIYAANQIEDSFFATVERGGISADGSDDASITSYEQWIRSAFFIKTNESISVSILTKQSNRCVVWQYDIGHQLISCEVMNNELLLRRDCSFIKFCIQTSDTPSSVPVLLKGWSIKPSEDKKVQMNFPYDRLVFAISDNVFTTALLMLPPNYDVDGDSVPLIIWDSGDGSFRHWDNYEGGKYPGRLNGIRYLRDQGFAVLEIYSWGSYYYKKYPGCGNRSAMPIPIHIAAHEKGVEYVISRYNINPDYIFHCSKSGSGKIALYYAMVRPPFALKSIYAFAPVFDDLNFVGWGMEDYRKALYEELQLKGTAEEVDFFIKGRPYDYDVAYKNENHLDVTLSSSWQMHTLLGRSFINKNAEKFKMVSVDWMNVDGQTMEEKIADTHRFSLDFWAGYNRHYIEEEKRFRFKWDNRSIPASRSNTYNRHHLVRHGSHIPFMVIMSPDDEQTPYWNALEVVNQLQNGGNDARMITLQSGGHSGPDLSTSGLNSISGVTTRLGRYYDNVSIGWYLAVEDIFTRFPVLQ